MAENIRAPPACRATIKAYGEHYGSRSIAIFRDVSQYFAMYRIVTSIVTPYANIQP